jgi:hypothetical protein
LLRRSAHDVHDVLNEVCYEPPEKTILGVTLDYCHLPIIVHFSDARLL